MPLAHVRVCPWELETIPILCLKMGKLSHSIIKRLSSGLMRSPWQVRGCHVSGQREKLNPSLSASTAGGRQGGTYLLKGGSFPSHQQSPRRPCCSLWNPTPGGRDGGSGSVSHPSSSSFFLLVFFSLFFNLALLIWERGYPLPCLHLPAHLLRINIC